jgi:hypothetical protein
MLATVGQLIEGCTAPSLVSMHAGCIPCSLSRWQGSDCMHHALRSTILICADLHSDGVSVCKEPCCPAPCIHCSHLLHEQLALLTTPYKLPHWPLTYCPPATHLLPTCRLAHQIEKQLAHHVRYLAPEAQPSQALLVALGVTRSLSWRLVLELLQGWAYQQAGGRLTCAPTWMAGGSGQCVQW